MINGIRAKGKPQDLYGLAIACQRGRVHMIFDDSPDKPSAYIIPASMFEELLLLEAGLYGVKKSDLLKDLEGIGLRQNVVSAMNRMSIYFVRDALRYLHLTPKREEDLFGINDKGAQQLVEALIKLGARKEVFFPHVDRGLRRFWLGDKSI